MELKNFVQTELGALPKDWSVKSCAQISSPVRGGSPRPAGDTRYFNGSYIPWLTVAALTNIPESQMIVDTTETFLTELGSRYSRTLERGTLIIANSGATLGVAKILGMKCCANDGIAALLEIGNEVDPYFLVHYINTKTKYLRNVVATGNGQPNLNTRLIGDFKVPLPKTKKEQEAIAKILSDADAYIEALEKLLAKKRLIKKGVMQELLTGKRRLEGFLSREVKQTHIGLFPSDWKVVALKSLSTLMTNGFVGSATKHYTESTDGVLYIQGYNVEENGFNFNGIKYVTRDFHQTHTKSCLQEDDMLMIQTGDVGLTTIVTKDLKGSNCHALIITRFKPKEANSTFISYYLNSTQGRSRLRLLETGTTMKHINVGDLLDFPVPIPPTMEEQNAIVKTLKDIQLQLGTLEKKLQKVRLLKQGMMQELLTGRIRLL